MDPINFVEYTILQDENGGVVQDLDFVVLKLRLLITIWQKFQLIQLSRPNTSVIPEPSNSSDSITRKPVICWTEEQTKNMLNIYKEHMDCVGPQKKLKSKKQLWEKISFEFSQKFGMTFTPLQVENRFKTSGNSKMETIYDKEMERIAALDDSMEPEVILTTHGLSRKRTHTESSENSSDVPSTSFNLLPRSSVQSVSSSSYSSAMEMKPQRESPIPAQRRQPTTNSFQTKLLELYKNSCEEKACQRHDQEVQRQKWSDAKLHILREINTSLQQIASSFQNN